MRKSAMIIAAASLIGTVSSAGPEARPTRRTKASGSFRPGLAIGSIAKINRWTGLPHEHRREIARRLQKHPA